MSEYMTESEAQYKTFRNALLATYYDLLDCNIH